MVLLGMLLLTGCKVQYVPVKETEYVTVRDSVYLRDTVIHHQIEKEYVKDYTGLLDTLQLETSYASASAWVDTTRNTLAGTIKNKEKMIDIPVAVKEKVVVRDSLVYRDVPVPVEKIVKTHYPYEKYLWGYVVLTLLALVLFLLLKYKK